MFTCVFFYRGCYYQPNFSDDEPKLVLQVGSNKLVNEEPGQRPRIAVEMLIFPMDYALQSWLEEQPRTVNSIDFPVSCLISFLIMFTYAFQTIDPFSTQHSVRFLLRHFLLSFLPLPFCFQNPTLFFTATSSVLHGHWSSLLPISPVSICLCVSPLSLYLMSSPLWFKQYYRNQLSVGSKMRHRGDISK